MEAFKDLLGGYLFVANACLRLHDVLSFVLSSCCVCFRVCVCVHMGSAMGPLNSMKHALGVGGVVSARCDGCLLIVPVLLASVLPLPLLLLLSLFAFYWMRQCL